MMKKSTNILLILTTSLLIGAGCSKPHPAPPRERSELVLRFFRSIQQQRPQEAVQQGRKLENQMHDKTLIRSLITLQQSNSYLYNAQQALNKKDLAAAEKSIRQGLKNYPDNRPLRQAAQKLQQLRNARKLLADMESAQTAPAMSAALTAASAGIGNNTTPELEKYFIRYRARIAQQQERERKLDDEPLLLPENAFEE